MPATIGLGAFTFTMSAMPGSPSVNNAIPMPYFGTTPFAAPGLGIIASAIIMLLRHVVARPRRSGRAPGRRGLHGAGGRDAGCPRRRPEGSRARDGGGRFRSGRIGHGKQGDSEPSFFLAVLPLAVVIVVNFLMSLVVLPRLDFSFLAEEAWGGTTIGAVAGVWSVVVALAAGSLTIVIVNRRRLPGLARDAWTPAPMPRSCRC